jgi:hypothetical protein
MCVCVCVLQSIINGDMAAHTICKLRRADPNKINTMLIQSMSCVLSVQHPRCSKLKVVHCSRHRQSESVYEPIEYIVPYTGMHNGQPSSKLRSHSITPDSPSHAFEVTPLNVAIQKGVAMPN